MQFDVRPGSANSVFRQLKTFQDGHGNGVAVEYVDATLGGQPAPASKHFVVQRDVAPVWELVEARIHSDAVYAPSFYVLLGIAGLIGAVGILTNSQILIVGAMVVGPEYNAIMGVALGIDKRARQPVLRGTLALLAGLTAAMAVTLLFGLGIRWSGRTLQLYPIGIRFRGHMARQETKVQGRGIRPDPGQRAVPDVLPADESAGLAHCAVEVQPVPHQSAVRWLRTPAGRSAPPSMPALHGERRSHPVSTYGAGVQTSRESPDTGPVCRLAGSPPAGEAGCPAGRAWSGAGVLPMMRAVPGGC